MKKNLIDENLHDRRTKFLSSQNYISWDQIIPRKTFYSVIFWRAYYVMYNHVLSDKHIKTHTEN